LAGNNLQGGFGQRDGVVPGDACRGQLSRFRADLGQALPLGKMPAGSRDGAIGEGSFRRWGKEGLARSAVIL